ncbi:TPA: hypothetical protein ACH9LV_005379, partial [Escherichia coli]
TATQQRNVVASILRTTAISEAAYAVTRLNAPEWRYYWQVNMPAATNTTWMTCGDPCDSALRIWGDTVVECVLNKLCPSHTYVIFKYPE